MAANELSLLNDPNISYSLTGSETIRRHYQSLHHKYDALKEEHEALRKRYSDLVGSHGDYVSKLELAQEESFRQRKSFEECIQERNIAIHERNGLKQQCTAAIRQWDKALRENNELKEELAKVKQHRDEAMKEINQAMAVRIKATKDMARLTEERNEALQEYTIIMSERDSVHKEIEKLQEEQQILQKRNKQLENEKKVLAEETESLKREISSALFDRDRVLKVCNDLREKYGDYVTGINDEATSPTSPQPRSGHNFWGSSSSGVSTSWAHMMSKSTNMVLSAASSNSSVSTFSHPHNKLCSNSRLDNIDQANTEIEALRKQMERLQTDLGEAQQEVEVCKRRRDWAFSERDKIVLERESIRTLCDKLRRERDRAVSDLAEALRESDDIKRQKNETSKELKELKEKIEGLKGDRDSRVKSQTQNPQLGTNNSSRDSAIEADLQEYEIETKDIPLKREHKSSEWGFKLSADDKTLFVDNVIKDSVADGKLRVNDILVKVNETPINNDLKIAYDLLKKNDLQIVLTVQRKRVTRFVQTINISVDKGQEHGLVLETGFYVSRINAGSVAAKEGTIAIGDRVLSINDKVIDEKSSYDVMQLLESTQNIVLQIMKNNSNICSQSNSNSSIVNTSKSSSESTDYKSSNHRERQKKMVSCCSQTDTFMSQPITRPPVPSTYQTISRTNGERNSAIINSTNKTLISSFNSSMSSSAGHEVQPPLPPAPTLLDKAYNKLIGDRKFFGERKQSSKPKQMQAFCEDETKTLAELDKVLDKYSNGKTYEKNSKYTKSGKSSKKEKNGGTWPKYRGHPPVPSLQNYSNVNAVTTLHPIKRKERKPLGIWINTLKPEKLDKNGSVLGQTSTAKPEEEKSSDNSDNIKEERMTPSSFLTFEPASEAALIDYERNSKRNSTLSSRPPILQSLPLTSNINQKTIYSSSGQSFTCNKSDTLDLKIYRPIKAMANSSLDYSVVSAQTKDKNVLDYYKHRTNSKQMRPHSVHDVLTDVTQPSLSLTSDHSSYDTFHVSSASSPPPNVAPIPPIRNSTSFAYYALNPPSQLIHVHHNHFGQNSHISRGTPSQPPVRHSNNSPLISPYISRSGDSLLSANESQTHSHDLSHSRSVSAYQGGVRPYTVKDNLVNRYSITPSPSPSQYSSGLFGGPSPSHSMDIITTTTSGAHFHNINQTKRMVAPQHSHQHQNHLHHSSINSNNSVYRSDDNNLGIPSFDGLSTFPKRNQRFRIPSNPSVTSKSSGGKLSTSSIDKASSSVLSDRSSPMPCAYHVEWLDTPNSSDSSGGERVAKPGDVRNIYIERSSAPSMGINIDTDDSAGIFISNVTKNSLAAQAGLLVGDQLLEICGINMRNATYTLACNVLRQCGDNIRMLVQYNPDKYRDDDNDSDVAEADEDDGMEEADEDDTAANDSTSTSTPQSSPIEHKSLIVRANTNNEENIPSSATSTLTRSKAASRSASNASRNTEKTLTDYSIKERQSSFKQSSTLCDPRRIIIKKTTSNLGISLFGGNAVGIFIHSVRDDSLANGSNGLKAGDQILEYNGVDLRNATAEEAAIELAKPAETVTLVAQYNVERFKEIQDQHTGDSFYIRAAFDRPSVDGSLAFRKDDILFVDNTMFNGVPGLWRAWLVDQEGQKVKCGVIPSKYKVEEELLMKRSLTDSTGDSSSRAATSARRSFFRRRKNNHQRSSSRESTKELASFSDVSINSFSESGAITAETDYNYQLLPTTYIRVERLSYKTTRPVIIIGPLQEVLSIKLEQDFQQTFKRCVPEIMKGSQQMMERWLQDLKLVDYRRDYRGSQGSHFECITVAAVKEICDKNLHALLEVSPTSVERLNKCQIYPVVVYLKFKSTKQIKEIKDHRYPNEKLTTKAAKEMYEHSLKIESEYKHLINVVIPGSNLSYMCTQVKTCVEEEQNKALWV